MPNSLPQLDTTYFVSQSFWLIVTFAIIYVFISFWFVPKVQNLLFLRKSYIKNLEKDLEILKCKLSVLEKNYSSSLATINEQADQLKQNAIHQFEVQAHEQITTTKQIVEQKIEQTRKDIADWQKNMEKDIKVVGFECIKYLIKKSTGIDIYNK